MLPQTLKFRVGFYMALALALAMALFTLLVIKHQRDQLFANAADHVEQISQLITRSTRYAMLQNQPDYVLRIIQDVGRQENIAKVRVLSKDGRIIHSTFEPEIGHIVDRKADACVLCHQNEQPLENLPNGERSRIYKGADGKSLLGSMEVIRNEPTCSSASCHYHPATQSVLGVLDIVYSLDPIERMIRMSTITIALASLAFVFLAGALVTLFVHRLVYLPLSDLEAGAERLGAGNLTQPIPVRSADELGKLAGSFNTMTEALRTSHAELQRWAQTLQEKVEARTSELRVSQAETARSEKLASVGLLAAGIAHELNNPLTGVLTFTTLLRRKLPEGSEDAEDMDLVIKETKRCAAIIRRLLDFARDKKPEKKYADLNRLIEETVRIVERPASLSNVEMSMALDPELPPVWLDADLIKQVVMNMVVNAQHAIENGGSIRIGTAVCAEPRSGVLGEPAVAMVQISIADSGCGIPPENLSRIFDPFFTSKEVGKGTGLGLAVSHGIVRSHGGEIEVRSTVGEGTTFKIFLPKDPPAAEAAGPGVKVET